MASKLERAFQQKVKQLINKAGSLENDEVVKVITLLSEARKEVGSRVASTEWQAYHLPQLKSAIEKALRDFGDQYGIELRNAQREFWELGMTMVDLPLQSVGIMTSFPALDTTSLAIMQGFSSDLVNGLTRDAIGKINQELTMGLMGQQTPFEVMKAIGSNLTDKSIFRSIAARAETITRTESGRILEMASQARKEQAAKIVTGLKKQWVHGHSAKHPRPEHVVASGQIRDVNEPFEVGGEKLMYPRDPSGSAKNTINCGCFSIPYHEDWGSADISVDAIAA